MGIIDQVKRVFGRGDTTTTADGRDENDLRMGDLSDRLRHMRGEKVTAMGPGQAPPRSSDAVEQMSKAARDARGADQLSEDDVLRGVKSYRSRGER